MNNSENPFAHHRDLSLEIFTIFANVKMQFFSGFWSRWHILGTEGCHYGRSSGRGHSAVLWVGGGRQCRAEMFIIRTAEKVFQSVSYCYRNPSWNPADGAGGKAEMRKAVLGPKVFLSRDGNLIDHPCLQLGHLYSWDCEFQTQLHVCPCGLSSRS